MSTFKIIWEFQHNLNFIRGDSELWVVEEEYMKADVVSIPGCTLQAQIL